MITLAKEDARLADGTDTHGFDAEGIEGLIRNAEEAIKPREKTDKEAVEVAGAAIVAFGLPAARSALMIRAAQDRRLGHAHDLVLAWLGYFTNGKRGYAFPSYDLLGELCGLAPKTIRNTCAELVAWGYLVRTHGNELGAHGQRGPSFALTAGSGGWPTLADELKEVVSNARQSIAVRRAQKSQGHGPDCGDDLAIDACHGPELGDVLEDIGPDCGDDKLPRVPVVGASNAVRWPHSSGPHKNSRIVEPEKGKSEPFDGLFGNNLDAEPAVKRSATSLTVHLPGQEAQRVTLTWLKGQRDTAPDELLMAFAETELHRFVAERPMTRQGKPMTLYGFLGVAFTYRFDPWLQSYRKPTSTTPRRRGFTA